MSNTEKERSLASKGAKNVGEITAAVTAPVGTLVSDVLESAGRSVGEAVGGLAGGVGDGYHAARQAIYGPDDEEAYQKWADARDRKLERIQRRRHERKVKKAVEPIETAMAQFQAMASIANKMGGGDIDYDKLAAAIARQKKS